MAAPTLSSAEMLKQLESARLMALEKPEVYNQFVPGFATLIQQQADVAIRRWGADFVAEAFSQPLMPTSQKEQLVNPVVPLLRHLLESQPVDVAITRSAIQAASSIYPLVFQKVCQRPDQALLWQDVTAIKLNILARLDSSPSPIRIMCIKFIQKVIQVQTPGTISDPRRPERNEISLALVPRNHPLLPIVNLEAETSALLDRLLSVVQNNSSDPLTIDATMNCLAVLIRTRPAISNKILATVLNYNPFKLANSPMTPRTMVVMKSLERTTRALLKFVARALPQHPMREKIDTYINRLQEARLAMMVGKQAQKRPAEPTDGLDNAKRQKMDQQQQSFPPMPPPPHTLAHVFTLTEDKGLASFDVKVLPQDLVTRIANALMQHIDSKSMDLAIEEVRQRFVTIKDMNKSLSLPNANGTSPVEAEEEDYDPEAIATETSTAPAPLEQASLPALEFTTFELPKPPPLSSNEVSLLCETTTNRLFSTALEQDRTIAQNVTKQAAKQGLNRLAATSNDRDSWLTTLIRLATRAPDGLDKLVELENKFDNSDTPDEGEIDDQHASMRSSPVSSRIRHMLFNYILEDWRHRLPIALDWLTEEWYTDRIASIATTEKPSSMTKNDTSTPNYDFWTSKLLEQLLPRFDASDNKVLVRFVGELPAINTAFLRQLRQLFRDPATVKIGNMALAYLYLVRPPVREMVVDAMQEVWEEGDGEVKEIARKSLVKWRPGFVEKAVEHMKEEAERTRTFPNGVKVEEFNDNVDPGPQTMEVAG